VTGAASGIGRALALGLWARGCHLALVDLDAHGLAGVQGELGASGRDQRLTTHLANVGDRERMRELAFEVAAAHGAVHLLINNAGVGYEAAFPQTSLEDWDHVLETNLWGVIHGCHFFMPHLARAGRAHIVNLCSLFGVIAMPGQTAYCATKFAVRGLSEALYEELRVTSVGLTLVYPGAVATDIMRRARGDDAELLQRVSRWYEAHAISPERAAALIIRAVEQGKPRLRITAGAVLADALKRLLPVAGNTLFVEAVIRTLGVSDMRAKRIRQWNETMVGSQTDPPARRR
jgi:NAD(P)-dependent dehydrogenase (short-subunit alcohol dehydrogenase family)